MEDLQHYIERFESKYLCLLFGDQYEEFCDDLVNGVPQSEPFKSCFEPFCDAGSCCNKCHFKSQGIKDMLTGFIYYHYVHDYQTRSTTAGHKVGKHENALAVSHANSERIAEQRWNESVFHFNAIKRKLKGGCCGSTCDLKIKTVFV